MEDFEVLPHTADVGIIAYGKSLPRVFENAARGMFFLITDLSTVQVFRKQEIELKSETLNDLMVDWLNELLYHFEVGPTVFKEFEITELDSTKASLKGAVKGEGLDLSRHPLKIQIKACTYYGLQIKGNNNWTAKVYFDV